MKSKKKPIIANIFLGLAIVTSGIVQACDSSEDMENEQKPVNTGDIEEKSNVLPILDKIELEKGASITIEDGPNDLMVVVTEYPVESSEYLDDLLDENDSIYAIYDTVASNREIPAAIMDKVNKFKTADVTALDNSYVPAVRSGDDQANSSVDEMSIQNKAVSRDVTYFQNTHCYADKISEASVRADWYRTMPKCKTERTGNFTQTQYGVRQTHMVFRPYRGSAYLKWYWNNNGTWTLGNCYHVAEGEYKQVRVGGTGIYDIKWETTAADGDGYNYTIHNAVGDINQMKLSQGEDKYQIFCNCDANSSLNTPRVMGILEKCMDNTLSWPDLLAATEYCHDWGVARYNVSSCSAPLNRERITATTSCSGAGGECWSSFAGITTDWNDDCEKCEAACGVVN